MADYSFMKSGFSNLVEPDTISDEFMLQLGGLIMAFMKNAVKIAAEYVEHAGRDGITPDDIKRGLQLEVFHFSKREDTPKNIEDTIEWLKNDIREYGSFGERGAMPDITEYVTDGEDIAISEPTFEFSPSTCTCANCKQVNAVNLLWDRWTPNTMLESILQRAINKIATSMS